ncbi:uncharacterized protein LOC142591573 [Dermacentor variabilis]|uniref:uncharacterized protein LOC142591573 n=1 Tax=Dermacentor variabilis TaxID=34621 RepID=UPI003F5BED48
MSQKERDVLSDLRELRSDMKQMKEGLEFMEKQFETMKQQFMEGRNERESLRKENDRLKAKCSENESIIVELQKRVVQGEQYSRRSNVEIKGLVEKNENIIDLVGQISGVVGEPISADDIEVCHRVLSREQGKTNVIVQFKTKQKRDHVVEKARKSRIRNRDVGISSEAQIFVNEHFCPTLKRLLAQAIAKKKKKRENQWQFVWTKNGKIFARKTESSQVVSIETDSDLVKIA